MSDEHALRKAIAAAPDEDMPRLAYADWLDEHRPDTIPSPARSPSARAEFIRVQCRLAAAGAEDPDYPELLERQQDLEDWLVTHDPDSKPDMGVLRILNLPSFGGSWSNYRRGFPEVMRLEEYGDSAEQTLDDLAAGLGRAFRETPARSLIFEDAMSEEIALFTEHPLFREVRGLLLDGLYEGEEYDVAQAIAESPHSRGLRRLYFDMPLDVECCRILAESRNLSGLESFELNYPISSRAFKCFANASWFRNLRRLQLWSAAGDMPRVLAEFPRMSRLSSLALSLSMPPTVAVLRRFAAADSFPRLSHLELIDSRLEPESFAILARAKWPLRHLTVERARVKKLGCESLATAGFAKSLRVLELSDCEITAGGVQALADSETLKDLKHLRLASNPIGPGGLAALAASENLRGLRSLNLDGTNMTKGPIAARHVVEFLSSLQTRELRHLSLGGLPVAVRGARVLAESPTFSKLVRLKLDHCSLGERGTAALVKSAMLTNLTALDLFGNKLGSSAAKLTNPGVFPRLGNCRLGHGISRKSLLRLLHRPGMRG